MSRWRRRSCDMSRDRELTDCPTACGHVETGTAWAVQHRSRQHMQNAIQCDGCHRYGKRPNAKQHLKNLVMWDNLFFLTRGKEITDQSKYIIVLDWNNNEKLLCCCVFFCASFKSKSGSEKPHRSHKIPTGQQVHVCLSSPPSAALWHLVTNLCRLKSWNYVASPRITIVILSNQAPESSHASNNERTWLFSVFAFFCFFLFDVGCHVPEMDGCCEASSTTFNSFINQASAWIIDWVNSEETTFIFFLMDMFFSSALCSRLMWHHGMSLFRHTTGYKMTVERRAIG